VRIYISVDMEGATGVVHRDQLTPEGKDYEKARKLLTGDVVAAVQGAVEAGATEVLVNDSHGNMRNVLIDELPPQARLIAGPASTQNKPLCQTQGADGGWDLAFLLCYHARAGSTPGLLAHTWVGSLIHEFRLNGEVTGETGINAAVLGHYGVPVGMVSGADDLVREASAQLEGVEAVEVKRTLGPTAADCQPPSATAELIRAGARRALERAGSFTPFRVDTPVTVDIVTHTREQARRAALAEGVERSDERRVTVRRDSIPGVMAAAWQAVEMALRSDSPWLS
jgi:D-amino peptidase